MLKNVKVMGKLALGFGIMLMFLLILGIISIQRMGVVNEQSTILAENWMPSIKVVEEINTNTSDFRLFQFEHVLSQSSEDMKKVEAKIESVLSVMRKNRAEYEKLISTPEEQTLYEDFSRKFDKYMDINKQLMIVSSQNKTEEAQKILHDSEVLFDDFSAVALKLVKINVDGGNQASITGDEIYAQAKITMISIIVISILLGIFVAYLITRSITSSLKELQDGLFSFFSYLNRESSKVELITLNSKDEFGDMSKVVNENILKTQKGIEEDRKLIDETIAVLGEFEQGDLCQRLNIAFQIRSRVLIKLLNCLRIRIS